MTKNQKDLESLYKVVVSFLRDSPMTLVMYHENNGHRICKATHEQASTNCATSALFFGNTAQAITYLKGYRDYFTDLSHKY